MKFIPYAAPMSYRTVAVLTIAALVLWTLGLPAWFHKAEAANVAQMSDTLSDSDLGVNALHTIRFTTPNGMIGNQSFRIYFDEAGSNFSFAGVTDADLLSGESGFSAVNSCTVAANEIDLSVGANYIEGMVCNGDTVASSTTIVIQVGDVNRVNNPASAGSYIISLQRYGATPITDVGDTRVAVIDDVTVTATVDTIFTFSINGVAPGVVVNNDVTPTSGTSTATTVPFGVIAPNVPKLMAQELRVDTNAYNGFSVTVQSDQTLTAGNNATIDEFIDNSARASSTVWQGPASTMGNTDTYGHWGLTSDDNVVASTTPNLWGSGQALYVGNFTNNPVEVFYHNAAVEQTAGMGVGSTTVAYKVEVSELQEAAKDYTATLTYIATPVF